MSDIVEEYKNLQRQVQQLQLKQERLRGRREELLDTLYDKFGIDSLKMAEKKYPSMCKTVDTIYAELTTVVSKLTKLLKRCKEKEGQDD